MRYNPIITCQDCNCDDVTLENDGCVPDFYLCPDCGWTQDAQDLEAQQDEKSQHELDVRRGK